jgi:hypothetical protein
LTAAGRGWIMLSLVFKAGNLAFMARLSFRIYREPLRRIAGDYAAYGRSLRPAQPLQVVNGA